MPSIVHIVTTRAFAGVERHVCEVATETARRGWDVAVVGGDAERMRATLGDGVRWEPGAAPVQAIEAILHIGRRDICHAHMTQAETIGIATRLAHRAPIVSTRHFAAARGKSRLGRIAAPWIASRIARELAASQFIAGHLERPPHAVVVGGVRPSAPVWRDTSRVVVVLQRLELEKDTLTALRAWQMSRLVDEGWSLRVVGDGSQRRALEAWVAAEGVLGVTFTGWSTDVRGELAAAGLLLAPAPAEPFGLSVLEAMAAGVPVVGCGAGGHLETVGLVADAPLFAPGDAADGAAMLRSLLDDSLRTRLSEHGRRLVGDRFTVERHVDRLLPQYEKILVGPPAVHQGDMCDVRPS